MLKEALRKHLHRTRIKIEVCSIEQSIITSSEVEYLMLRVINKP